MKKYRAKIIRSTRHKGTEDLSYHEFDTDADREEFMTDYNTVHLDFSGSVPEVYTIAEVDNYSHYHRRDVEFKVKIVKFSRFEITQIVSWHIFLTEKTRQYFIREYNAAEAEHDFRKDNSYSLAIAVDEDRVV